MRVLLSLGNRTRNSSSNSETNDEYSGIVETSTKVESSKSLKSDPLQRAENPSATVAEEVELIKRSITGAHPAERFDKPDREKNSSRIENTDSVAINRNNSLTSLTRLHSSTVPTEVYQLISKQESLGVVISSSSVLHIKSKRSRSFPLPDEKNDTSQTRRKMAVGGRFKSDSDDESSFAVEVLQHQPRRFWVEPAENEAPCVTNSNPAIITSDINDVDDDEVPRNSAKESDHVEVSATSSNETYEEQGLTQFLSALKKRGFEMIEQEGDGNCLFRAVSLQVYGSSDNHTEVRERCMDYMAQNEEHFSDFIAASSDDEMIIPQHKNSISAFQAYIARKRISGVHGNHTEIQALSELFNRPVEVYTPETLYADIAALQPMNIFHEEYKTSDPPIRLSYHDGNHYNAIIDPLIPTAGLGLGLPGLKVGLADKMQITKAITESDQLADQLELERVLKESREEIRNQTDDELQKVLTESSRDFVSVHLDASFMSMSIFLCFTLTSVRLKMYEQKTMALSDLDQTNYALEQKVLASSMETYFRQEHGRKQRATVASAGSSSRRRRCSPDPQDVDSTQSNVFANSPSAALTTVARSPAVASSTPRDAPTDSTFIPSIDHSGLDEEYPQVVQELVMNGFELQDVIRAYEFVGDRFDDLLSLLLSSNKSS